MTESAMPSVQLAFTCGRNLPDWFRKMGSTRMAALLSLGMVADLWLGM